MTIGINLPLEVAFNVVPNSSELGWTWADTSGGAQSWNFHDGDAAQHAHLRINIQFWNGTDWSASRTLRTWTSGWENLPPEYTQGSPFDVGNYLTEIGWSGVSSQPLIKVTFWNLLNNGTDGNVNLTAGESPLVYLWNTENGTVDRLSTTGPELVLNGDATTTVVQGQEYSDLGATAYDLDGTVLSTTTSGDIVNSNDPINTEFVVVISATSNITGISSDIDRIVTVVSAAGDTSNEDDSSPNNGDAQNMEENIMSNFTFGRLDKDAPNKPAATKYDNIYLTKAEIIQTLQDKLAELSGLPDNDPVEIEVRSDGAGPGTMYAATQVDENGNLTFPLLGDMSFYQALSTTAAAQAGYTANVLTAKQAIQDHIAMHNGFLAGVQSDLPSGFGYFETGSADVHTETTASKSGKDFLSALSVRGIQSCEDINVHGDIIMVRKDDADNDEEFRFTELVHEVQLVHGYFFNPATGIVATESEIGSSWFVPMDPVLSRKIKNWKVSDFYEEMLAAAGFGGDNTRDFGRTSNGVDVAAPDPKLDSISGRQIDSYQLVPADEAEGSSLSPDQAEGLTVEHGDGYGGVYSVELQDLKWWTRLTKANGDVVFKEFKPVNDLVSATGAFGSTLSVLAGMQDIKDLQDAARYMFAELNLASIEDIDTLELKMTSDLMALMGHINLVETELAAYIKAEDERISAFTLARLDDLSDEIHDLEEAIRFSGEVAASGQAGVLEFIAPLDEKMAADDLGCWKFDVASHVGGIRRGDLEAQFEARKVNLQPDSSLPEEPAIKVEVFFDACALTDNDGPATIVVNAIYAGALGTGKVSRNPNGETTEAQPLPVLPLALNDAQDGGDDLRKIDDVQTVGAGGGN